MPRLNVDADLRFSIEVPASGRTGARRISGTVTGQGTAVDVTLDETPAFDPRSAGPALRVVAQGLSRSGLQVSVRDRTGLLATVGAVRPSFLARLVLRSRHVRLGRLGTVAAALRRQGRPVLSVGDLMPPLTPFPPAPTLGRQARRVTTTHDPEGGGRPRFYFPGEINRLPGARTREFYLRVGAVTTIGSDPSNHLMLDGLEPFHAEVRRDEWDEYWIAGVGDAPMRVNGGPTAKARMRTGTKVQLGRWTMNYFRSEHADHGRPYGGRIGGEAGHQIPQEMPVYRQPRPDR